MDADGDGRLSWADMKLLYDAVQRSCSGGMLLHFEDLMNQIRDMVSRQREPASGFTAQEMWECKLGAGVIGLLTNANNMLLQRSTAEWGRGERVWAWRSCALLLYCHKVCCRAHQHRFCCWSAALTSTRVHVYLQVSVWLFQLFV
jgi:hypothetical protein